MAAKTSFAFETTLGGLTYTRSIPAWQQLGFGVDLIFLSLPSVELAIARVAVRVQQRGHHVADDVVRRRYTRGWYNLEHRYKPLVDTWELFDNSGETPLLLERGGKA